MTEREGCCRQGRARRTLMRGGRRDPSGGEEQGSLDGCEGRSCGSSGHVEEGRITEKALSSDGRRRMSVETDRGVSSHLRPTLTFEGRESEMSSVKGARPASRWVGRDVDQASVGVSRGKTGGEESGRWRVRRTGRERGETQAHQLLPVSDPSKRLFDTEVGIKIK